MTAGDEEKPAPSFGALLGANLKVLGIALLLALLAFGIWRGLSALFPEVSWLQPPRR